MDLCRWTLGFLLLIQLTLCFKNKNVFLEKSFRSGADMTPVCSNATDNFIFKVHCSVQTGNNGSVICSLQYVPGRRIEGECGSRITLQVQNQTVFLNLIDLTPEDSGLYLCECFTEEDILILHLNITVKVKERGKTTDNKKSLSVPHVIIICSSVTAFIIILGVIMAVIYKRICCRKLSQPAMEEGEEMEMDTYAALQQPSDDVYQTIGKRSSVGVSVSRQTSHTGGEYEYIENNTK